MTTITKFKMAACGPAICLFIISCTTTQKAAAPKGFEKLPAPKTAWSEVQLPSPVRPTQPGDVQTIQLGNHGFLFHSAGKPLTGPFTAEGEVVTVAAREITVRTADKGNISMRYALPAELQLPIKKGDRLTIRYQPKFYANSRGYILVNQLGEQLLHSSARLAGPDTLSAEIVKGLRLYQETDKSDSGQRSDFGVLTQLPVRLSFNQQNIPLTTGKVTEVDYAGAKYTVLVISSVRMQPSEQKRSTSEGDEFSLEYVLVKSPRQ